MNETRRWDRFAVAVLFVTVMGACANTTTSRYPDGTGAPTPYQYVLETRVVTTSAKRGTISDITYRAELFPDPEAPGNFIGPGYYLGFQVGCGDDPTRVEVEGDLDASVSERSRNQVIYTLTTTDWRWPRHSKRAEEEEEELSEEELEKLAALGSVQNVLEGVKLKGTRTVATRTSVADSGSGCAGEVTTAITETVDRLPIENVLRAVARVSRVTLRGEVAVLDGSLSTPPHRIGRYEWKLSPDDSCPKGVREMTYTEKVVSVMLLCGMNATLTVTEKEGSADASAPGSMRADSITASLPVGGR
ncbi:hypothetical protein HPC49_44965 [Pyxidicoccus fallax]|uniref:Lipoprotein n=1 Tax=Pyxidicoccus fallax TaxID=394095 RepID=A0A848LKU8_9BACT|nr:hypothetical protein [Pyxidicoccus fallax]NMO18320.1 hypothetical protein [Pyxidicoccus fallax]NPC85335.1 hypothetical protein [Pyxidicoccus fallax]